ncbi:MAG: methyltransferase domain-containing protein [Candidatus Komeilibacteria bacterium]|nr:methyltransferase domain-containing protein [Candidatus Komeilibacteria bacterium]
MASPIISGGNALLQPRVILKEHLHVAPSQIVGNFGCGGGGFFTLESARMVGESGQVYAVDIVKNALSSVDGKAKLQGLYNVKTIWSDLEIYGATDIPEASLDHGLLVNILFQSKKHDAIVREVTRFIKPGGKLLIIDWNNVQVPFGPPLEDRVKVDELRMKVPSFGYQEEKFFEAGQYHFGLIFIKL